MKTCPTCRMQFPDDQTFCLHDGTVLVDPWQSEREDQTVINPSYRANQPPPVRKGSNLAVYAILAVLLLAVAGTGAIFLFRGSGDYDLKKKELELKEKELELERQKLASNSSPNVNSNMAGEKPLPPVQPVTIPNAQRYSGSVGNSEAVFDLVWKKDRTVSGAYFYIGSPSQIYPVSGSNYSDGELLLTDQSSGARIQMSKTLTNGRVCWRGNYYANSGTSTIGFCRYR